MKTKPGSTHEETIPPAADPPAADPPAADPPAADPPAADPPAADPPAADPPKMYREDPKAARARGAVGRTVSRMIAQWLESERKRGYLTPEIEEDATNAIAEFENHAGPS